MSSHVTSTTPHPNSTPYIDQSVQSDTKYLDTARSREYLKDVSIAFSKGAAIGTGVFALVNRVCSGRYPGYRALPLPAKTFLGMMTIVPVGVVFAEKAGEHYISSNQWASAGQRELSREAAQREERWNAMTTTEKIKDWSSRNQYTIIGGSWVASLGIAFGIVARNKYQTFPQKLVQARMYAQGLTVAVLIASAVLAGVNAKGQKPQVPNTDHSWKLMLEQGGSMGPEERYQLRTAAPASATTESA